MPSAYNPAAWSDFFAAQIGASAALTGLIFVAVSINLTKIVGNPLLVPRCAKALTILLGVLLASTLALAPGQPLAVMGWELIVLGATVWMIATRTQHSTSHKNPYVSRWQRVAHMVLTQCAAVPFMICGASLLFQWGGGLYWLLAAVVFSFITALLDAWVLLIEIQR